jgi:hypothetical protein
LGYIALKKFASSLGVITIIVGLQLARAAASLGVPGPDETRYLELEEATTNSARAINAYSGGSLTTRNRHAEDKIRMLREERLQRRLLMTIGGGGCILAGVALSAYAFLSGRSASGRR